MRFKNRTAAGQLLAAQLTHYADCPDAIVLALPRGGVPVAYEVAAALHLPLDIFLVRKLGVPGQEELAMGAIASGGVRVLNAQLVQELQLSEEAIAHVTAQEQRELERREWLYRKGRPDLELQGKTAIVVDDGLATGATMRAAITALKQNALDRIVIAVPAASPETCADLRNQVDEIICLLTPQPFMSVGLWYDNFAQTTDAEVQSLLERSTTVLNPTAIGR